MRHAVGLDIGGANLKAASQDGHAVVWPHALWKDPHGLAEALSGVLAALPDHDSLHVTMTGELCDCFASKRIGVEHILNAVAAVAGTVPAQVWRTDGRFVDLTTAQQGESLLVAASNWLALATWAGRYAPEGSALVIDIGSTTTDIIPLLDGVPVPQGRTDPERMRSNELVYAGARRTPVCAVLGLDGVAEWFATLHDVFLVLGEVAGEPNDTNTPDGRPADVSHAHGRLARMLCADLETSTEEERQQLAEQVRDRLLTRLASAVSCVAWRLPTPPRKIILAGSGEFLGHRLFREQVLEMSSHELLSLSELLGESISQAACAYALAVLGGEGNVSGRRESGR